MHINELTPNIQLRKVLLIGFVTIFFAFSCSSKGSMGIATQKDGLQVDTVKNDFNSVTLKPNILRDTVIIECFNPDCSEGVKRYFIKGNLNGESYFMDNESFIVNKHYYENNGPLAQIDTLINFKLVGLSVTYYPNGQIQRTRLRNENGIEIGPYQSYYENGQKKLIVPYVNGNRNGEMIEYYQNGRVKNCGEYKNDKRHGLWRSYDISGYVKEEKKYDNGVEIK